MKWLLAKRGLAARFIGEVLDKVFNPATEKSAKAIQCIALDICSMVISQLRERHSIQASCFSNFLDGHSASLSEFEVGDTFLELEP